MHGIIQGGDDLIMISEEIFARAASVNGGWSRNQLALLGVPYPHPAGWKRRLLGKWFPRSVVDRFITAKNAHVKARDIQAASMVNECVFADHI